jgi:signal transduction histidine kinase
LEDANNASPIAGMTTLVMSYQRSEEFALVDETLIRHCLSNLLSNAVKYSPEGGEVCLRVSDHVTGIEFEVIDHGIGISLEDLPHLFETFHRASNVGSIPGTGLGLAIVKRSAERHGGAIEVDSVLGEGTRIAFTVAQVNDENVRTQTPEGSAP